VHSQSIDQYVSRYVSAFILCNIRKLRNSLLGLYTPLCFHLRTYESITMDFLGGFPRKNSGNDYFLVVVDRFNKMCVLTPCKKIIKSQETVEKLHEKAWIQFYLPKYIILDRDTRFLSFFWTML
jgi:hypothetical protein